MGSAAAPSPVISTVFAEPRPAAGSVGIARAPLGAGDEAVVLVYSATPGAPDDIPIGDRDRGQEQLAGQAAQQESKKDENVVDAEFTEVKDKKAG